MNLASTRLRHDARAAPCATIATRGMEGAASGREAHGRQQQIEHDVGRMPRQQAAGDEGRENEGDRAPEPDPAVIEPRPGRGGQRR